MMKWINRKNAPNTSENLHILLAEFTKSGKLKKLVPGWWYCEEYGGFYAPDKYIRFTHYMPYDEYWAELEQVEREQ